MQEIEKQNQFAARKLSFWEITEIEKQAYLDKLWGGYGERKDDRLVRLCDEA